MGTATSSILPPPNNNNLNNATLATLLEGHAIITPTPPRPSRQRQQSHNADDDASSTAAFDDDDNTTITSSDNNTPTTMTNNWNAIHYRITHNPEETMLYGHSLEPSPLQRALSTHTIPPLSITRAFVNAYEEALHSRDERGRTLLHSLTATHAWTYGRRTTTTTDDDESSSLVVVADTARYILSLVPDMISSLTLDDTCLALHYCRNNIHLARVLVEAHSEGLRRRDKWGRIPLHRLFLVDDDRPNDDDRENDAVPCLDVVRLFMSEGIRRGLGDGGGVLSRDRYGVTPLRRLCEMIDRRPMVMIPNNHVGMGSRQRRRQRGRPKEIKDKDETSETQSDVTLSTVEETDDDDDDDVDDDNSSDNRLCHILYHVARHAVMNRNDNKNLFTTTNTKTSFLFLHSLLTLNCTSPPTISLALSLHPHQCSLRNPQGYTPLRLSLAPPTPHPIPTKSIQLILQTHPTAARMTDNDGRLPIDVVASEWSTYDGEVVEALLLAEPRAVDTRDLRDYMFPFLTAAIGGSGGGGGEDVNAVYHLLRAKPHVLRYFGFGC